MVNNYGLLGGTLGHSLSPKIHQLFFKYTAKKGEYNLIESDLQHLPSVMQILKSEYVGCNVTIPHKINIVPFLDSISKEAKAIGAVNTIKFTSQGDFGYNTDYYGFGKMLDYYHVAIERKIAVVLGTGGAARAVVKYLADKNIDEIYLVTRDTNKIDKSFYKLASNLKFIKYDQLKNIQGDMLINCTPVGMYPNINVSPVTAKVSENFAVSIDLIYNPLQTLFLNQAVKSGKQAINGLFMLVAQAVAAQEIWQEEHYDNDLILKIINSLEQSL